MDPELRIADTDREAVVERLRGHAGEGRLDADELEERIALALAARTAADLEPLVADLPPGPLRTAPRRERAEVRSYLWIMGLLVAIWALTGAGYFWPVWPALGWGLALAMPGSACGMRRPHAR